MFTKVDERLWSDEKYRKLSDDGKLLFIYVLACSHRNMIGLYLLPVQYGSYDLNWKEERFNKGLVELSDKSFIKYNFNTNIVYIKNFLKYNPLENPNQVKGAIKVLESIPTNAIDTELIKELERADKPFNKPLIELLYKGLSKQEEVEVDEEVDVDEVVEKINNRKLHIKIIEYLNLKTNKEFKTNTKTTTESIDARLNEGFTVEDFIEVIDTKAKEWKNDKQYQKFLRPQTLFGNKFEGYLNQAPVKSNKPIEKYIPNIIYRDEA